eukprot:g16445.t3
MDGLILEGKDDGKSNKVHIRMQQRNGRKSWTTVAGFPESVRLPKSGKVLQVDFEKILRALKKTFKTNGVHHRDPDHGSVLQLQGDIRKDVADWLACAFGSSAERGLASLTLLTRPRSGEEVKPEETSEQRDGRRRSSSSSGDGRQCVTPMAAEHSEASEKIKARIHKQWKGEAVVQSRKSLRGDSRSPNVGAKEGLVTSSRSTSAGVSPQRDQSNRSTGPPAAFAPPVTRAQREIIQLDHQYGATLRKVKSIYDSHLDGITELRRENDRLRAALAPGAWSQLRPSPSVAGPLAVPVGAPLGVAQQFPLNGAGRPQAVPRLNLQGLYPAN